MTIPAACSTVEVPFQQPDGDGGGSGGEIPSGSGGAEAGGGSGGDGPVLRLAQVALLAAASKALELLASAGYTNFTLEGDRILATRGQAPMYLASMSKEGGAWFNVLRLGEHDSCKGLFVRGARFFTECRNGSGPSYVLTGPWAGGNPKGFKLAQGGAWSGTEGHVYIADDTELVGLELD